MNEPEFRTIGAFYDADPRRRSSGEADYGVHWHDQAGNSLGWPRWRVSYIQATGEVYAVCQRGSPAGPVRVLGVVPPDQPAATPGIRGDRYYRTLDTILDGWADPAVSGFDLAWVAQRLTGAGDR